MNKMVYCCIASYRHRLRTRQKIKYKRKKKIETNNFWSLKELPNQSGYEPLSLENKLTCKQMPLTWGFNPWVKLKFRTTGLVKK